MFDIETYSEDAFCKYITITTKDNALTLNIPNSDVIQISWSYKAAIYNKLHFNKIKIDTVDKCGGTTDFKYADNTTHREHAIRLYNKYKETGDGQALLNFMIDMYNNAIAVLERL